MTKPVAELTDYDREVCRLASELTGTPLLMPWVFENALYRHKIGDKVPDHLMQHLERARKELDEKGETAE
jgi:hypothetical protein